MASRFPSDLQATQIASLAQWGRVIVRNRGAVTVRFATSRLTLENPAADGQVQGISLAPADGIQSFPWIGPLWAMANGAGAVLELEIPEVLCD